MPNPIRILLLGPPSITYDDAPLRLTRRAHRTLLLYMACHRQPVPRSELVLLLWQDASPETGRARLRELLARVRSELPSQDLLEVDRERIGLVEEGFDIDVRRFETLTLETTRLLVQLLPSTPLPEGLRAKMVEAVELWRTPHFMEGVELPESEALEMWLTQTRQQLEAAYVRLLERLAEHDMVMGNFAAAMNWLQKALACSPFNDILHARLICLFEKQSMWSEALNHIQFIEKMYDQDGSEITPALMAVAQRVRERAALGPDEQTARWPGRTTVRVPMFGRQAELEQLRAAWRRGATSLIYGEAGSGKTRLVQELAANLDPSPRLLVASARALENGLSFQPLVDMLRQEVKIAEWRELPRNWQSALALLLPELTQTLGVQPPPFPAGFSQPLLLEAIHKLLLHLRNHKRLLILVDDAQWCDKTSLETLAYLIERNFFGGSAGLILACRVEESNPAFSHFVTHLPEQSAPVILRLNPLDPDSVTKITRFVLGFSPSTNLSERLQQETGGNPLFLLETLRVLLDYNLPQEQIETTEQVPLAGSIQTLVRERLKHLSAPAHQTLHLAAIIGSQIPMAVLSSASTIAPERLVDAVEELEKLHLLQSDPQLLPGGGYRFIHEKIRELVLMELGLARRQMMHLRVAQALEAIPGSPAAVLAGHYEKAGEVLSAFDNWFRAAQHARSLYSAAEASTAYQRAEEIVLRHGSAIPEEKIYIFYQSWGGLAFDTSDLELLEKVFLNLLQIGQSRSSKLLIAFAHLSLAIVCELLDQVDAGLRHLSEADIFLPELARSELIVLSLCRRGGLLILSNNYRDGTEALEQAREMAVALNSSGTAELLTGLDYRLAFARLYAGLPAKSIEVAEEALHRSRAAINQPFIARALAPLSYANYLIGHSHLALNQARDGFQISEGFKNERLMAMFLVGQAQVELLLGQADAALLHARQALELSRAPHLFRTSSHAYRILGDLFRYLGDSALARGMYTAGLDVPQPGYHTVDIQYRLACLLAEEGRLKDAFDLIEETQNFSERAGFSIDRLGIMVSKATILQIAGRSNEVLRLAEDCAVQATSANLPLFRCESYLLIGNNLLQTGRVDEARQKMLAVVQSLRELRYPFLELGALRLLTTVQKASAMSRGETTGRMRSLLEQLEANHQSKDLRPLFETFRDRHLQWIEAVE